MRYLILIFIVFTLNSCKQNKEYTQHYNRNIQESSLFDDMVDPAPVVLQRQDTYHSKCLRAYIKVNKISLDALAELLGLAYNEEINVSNLSENHEVSLNLQNACLQDVFNELTEVYNIGYDLNSRGYTIYPPKVVTRIFTLHYHNFNRSGQSSMSVNNKGSGGGGASSISTKIQDSFWENIQQTLEVIIQDDFGSISRELKYRNIGGKKAIHIDKTAGTITVRSFPRSLKKIEELIDKINATCMKQVMIEAKIIEVELKDEFSTGIQWSALENYLQLTKPQTLGSNIGLITSALSMKIGQQNKYFSQLVELLSAQGKVSVLSSPKISVLNNQRALIKFGEDSYYITNVKTTSNKDGSSSQSSFDMKPFFSGIALDTTATVISPQEVLLHIHPMITRVTADDKSMEVDGRKTSVPYTKVETRETDTIVRATSGEVIIIGGLVHKKTNDESSGLPIKSLKDIFGSTKKSNEQTELVILIRPVVVDSLQSKVNLKKHIKQY